MNKKIIALVLGFLVVAGGMFGAGYYTGATYSGKDSTTVATNEANVGNVIVEEKAEDGISIHMAKVYSGEVGVSAANSAYESAYEITAEVNTYSMDRTITWGLSWDSTSDISDYVSLSAETSEAGSEIYLYCYGAFDTQITLTATCGELSATCAVDYAARVTGYSMYISYEAGDVQPDEIVYGLATKNYCSSGATTAWLSDGDLGLVSETSTSGFVSCTNDSYYSLTFGTGTKEDTLSDYSIVISFADDVKTDIETALGLDDATYTVMSNRVYQSDVIDADMIFNAFFGSDVMSEDEYKSKVYNALIDYYTADTAIFKITLTGTGSQTNIDYSFDAWATFNPSAYYVSVSSLSLSAEEVCF